MHADTPFRWAVIGPGRIAHKFAEVVHRSPGMRLQAVAGRDGGRAQAFADAWARDGRPAAQVHGSVQALLDDPAVDAVYIATPHDSHGQHVRQALLAGKPVLCEKPLVPFAALAQELLALAAERRVFLMEGLWTRFLPVYDEVATWLREGRIGTLRTVQSSFGFNPPYDPQSRLYDPALAGGALLDIGVYCVGVSRWALEQACGRCPPLQGLQATGRLAPTGVDQHVAATLRFEGGALVQFVCGFDQVAENALLLIGTEGFIRVEPRFWGATAALLQRVGEPPQRVERPLALNGFEGEVEESVRCVRAGLLESPRMPHAESLALVQTLDALRAELGVRYPFE